MKLYIELLSNSFNMLKHFIAEVNRFCSKEDVVFEFDHSTLRLYIKGLDIYQVDKRAEFKVVIPMALFSRPDLQIYTPGSNGYIRFAMTKPEFQVFADQISKLQMFEKVSFKLTSREGVV